MEYLVNDDVTTDQQAAVKLGWLDYVLWFLFAGICFWALLQQGADVETPKELVVVTKHVCAPTPVATEWGRP